MAIAMVGAGDMELPIAGGSSRGGPECSLPVAVAQSCR
jgi:hypothetical protein